MPHFLLVDGSYYVFYRFYALIQWWSNAKSEEKLGNPIENAEFVDKFRSIFTMKIQEMVKKLKMEKPIIIVAMDCKRCDIWRNDLFDTYKQGRVCSPYIGDFFKLVVKEELFKSAGANMLLCHPKLEADDCIALTVKNINRIAKGSKIHIITSDMDYLQLANDLVIPINLKYKPLQESKQSFKDSKKDLFCKIVMGDKSDAIPSVFPKCGIKTAEKYYNDPALFEQKIKADTKAQEQFELNTTLIDFEKIPNGLILEFNSGNYTTKY